MQFSMLFLGNLDFQVWPGDWYLFSILITTGKKNKKHLVAPWPTHNTGVDRYTVDNDIYTMEKITFSL